MPPERATNVTATVSHSVERMPKLFNVNKFYEKRNLRFNDDLVTLCRHQYSIFQMLIEQNTIHTSW